MAESNDGTTNNLTYSEDRIDWKNVLETGSTIQITVQELRRERTGLHGIVHIGLNGRVLESDQFNLTRSTDRRRLGAAAYRQIDSELDKGAYSEAQLQHDIGSICRFAAREWEAASLEVSAVPAEGEPVATRMAMAPYIVDGGGTILFGAPESGKTFVTQVQAICIARGITTFWPVEKRPVIYINLERPRQVIENRELQIRAALGIGGAETGVSYIHARGHSLDRVVGRAREIIARQPGAIVFLDSISRSGYGTLVADDTATRIIDQLNSLRTSWCAIAHTPRSDNSHIYGSIHFTAGADVEIRIQAESMTGGATVGLMLQVTKANDIRKPRPAYLALEFGEAGLTGFRTARLAEFPQLAESKPLKTWEKVRDYILDQPEATAAPAQIAIALKMDMSNLGKVLKTDVFVQKGKDKRGTLYGVSSLGL